MRVITWLDNVDRNKCLVHIELSCEELRCIQGSLIEVAFTDLETAPESNTVFNQYEKELGDLFDHIVLKMGYPERRVEGWMPSLMKEFYHKFEQSSGLIL